MTDGQVLVAFANQVGSTAGIAATIAGVLRRAGLDVDIRPWEPAPAAPEPGTY